MHNTPFLRALVASAALALVTPAMAAPVGGVLTLGDVAQASALGSIDLGGPALLLGTASTLYEDDAPLTAGALNLSGTAAADVATLTHDMGLPGDAFDARQGFALAVAQVIYNHHLVARSHQFDAGVRADIARATGDQHTRHGYSLTGFRCSARQRA